MFRKLLLTFLILACMNCTLSAAETSYFVYVSIGGEKKIARSEMNPETGELTKKGDTTLPGGPGSLTIDPTRNYLFASIRNTKSVASFRIDQKTGELKLLGNTPVVDNPVFITTDRTGKFLLTAYYGAGKIAIYPIQKGIVQEQSTQILMAMKNPHSIRVDRANRFVYVPCTGADTILQFRFDPTPGILAPLETAKVTTQNGAGPRHFYFHPKREDILYVVNEKNSSTTVYQRNPREGELKAIQTWPTLPKGWKGRNTCADIEVTPNGKFVYASNRGHDSLAMFAIDQKTGKLTPIGQAPTEKTPREFTIDPTGKFVYSAGQGSGKMVAYRIEANGKLKTLKTYKVGKSPSWVMVVPITK